MPGVCTARCWAADQTACASTARRRRPLRNSTRRSPGMPARGECRLEAQVEVQPKAGVFLAALAWRPSSRLGMARGAAARISSSRRPPFSSPPAGRPPSWPRGASRRRPGAPHRCRRCLAQRRSAGMPARSAGRGQPAVTGTVELGDPCPGERRGAGRGALPAWRHYRAPRSPALGCKLATHIETSSQLVAQSRSGNTALGGRLAGSAHGAHPQDITQCPPAAAIRRSPSTTCHQESGHRGGPHEGGRHRGGGV